MRNLLKILPALILICLSTVCQANNRPTIQIFKADLEGRSVVLRWIAQKKSTKYFVIEKSVDGIHFRSFKRVVAEARHSPYEAYDVSIPRAMVVHYRLKQVTSNNYYSYSATNRVCFKLPKLRAKISIKLEKGGKLNILLDQLRSRKVLVYGVTASGVVAFHHYYNTYNKSSYQIKILCKHQKSKYVKVHILTDQSHYREKIKTK